jgi:hypothetical protein
MIDDRAIIVDKITLRAQTKPSGSCNLTLEYEESGTAQGGGTVFAAAVDLNSVLTDETSYDMPVTTTANLIPANSVINVLIGTSTGLVDFFITIRYRSKRR